MGAEPVIAPGVLTVAAVDGLAVGDAQERQVGHAAAFAPGLEREGDEAANEVAAVGGVPLLQQLAGMANAIDASDGARFGRRLIAAHSPQRTGLRAGAAWSARGQLPKASIGSCGWASRAARRVGRRGDGVGGVQGEGTVVGEGEPDGDDRVAEPSGRRDLTDICLRRVSHPKR